MLKVVIVATVLSFATFLPASSIPPSDQNSKLILQTKEGNLKLSDVISSCSEIGKSTPNKFVNKFVVGKIIEINGKKYEVRYFSFEDTKGSLSKDTDFLTYVEKNKLSNMLSIAMNPLPGIHFESFDFRRVNLKDGVYFSMALRLVE